MRLIDMDAAIEAVCEEVMDRFFVPPSAGYDVAEEALKKLPSIQPETNCSEIPNNSDTISRQEAIDALDKRFDSIPMEQTTEILLLRKDLRNLPSAQPERKTGRWIPVTNGRGGHQCDRCGSYAPSYQSGAEWLSNFCPECNADMRGEQ